MALAYLSHYKDGNAAIITINRRPANALSFGLLRHIGNLLDQIEQDSRVRALLIPGEGRFFSAGADTKGFTEMDNGEEFSRLAENGQDVFEKVENFPKPSIAAIHGAALGGGLELAMACHIRLVSENAKLGLPELQLGLIPGFAGTQRLPRYVGTAKAYEMLFTSETISGKEAVEWGLCNHYFREEQLLAEAKNMAKKIAEKSSSGLKAIIDLLQYSKTENFYEG